LELCGFLAASDQAMSPWNLTPAMSFRNRFVPFGPQGFRRAEKREKKRE
jgi:hypothetical protein